MVSMCLCSSLLQWNLERPGDFSIPESTFYVLKTEHGEGWLGKTSKPKHPTDTIEGLPVRLSTITYFLYQSD